MTHDHDQSAMNDDTKRLLGLAAAAGFGFWALRRVARRARRIELADRTVLVTGGSRGLGLVLARELADHGARLVLCARNGEELERAANDLAERGAPVQTVVCDVCDAEAVRHMVEEVEAVAPIDVVINNAGVIQTGPMETMTDDDYATAIDVHFAGPRNVIDAVLPGMKSRGAGRVVNIASIGGIVAVPHLLPYCAGKFALVGYSLGLRSELAKDGVVVTTICPGLMRTGSPRNALFKGRNRAEYALFKISDSLPLLTISAETAARRIVDACRHGDAFVVLGGTAKLAAIANAFCPGLVADTMGIINRLLPTAGGIGTHHARGHESESAWSETWLTTLTDRAAMRNNE